MNHTSLNDRSQLSMNPTWDLAQKEQAKNRLTIQILEGGKTEVSTRRFDVGHCYTDCQFSRKVEFWVLQRREKDAEAGSGWNVAVAHACLKSRNFRFE